MMSASEIQVRGNVQTQQDPRFVNGEDARRTIGRFLSAYRTPGSANRLHVDPESLGLTWMPGRWDFRFVAQVVAPDGSTVGWRRFDVRRRQGQFARYTWMFGT